jgi:hypothetical protein
LHCPYTEILFVSDSQPILLCKYENFLSPVYINKTVKKNISWKETGKETKNKNIGFTE